MNILFVIDRLELKYFEFNNLVTNFWLIKELLSYKNSVAQQNKVFITTIDNLSLKMAKPYAGCWKAFEKDGNIFYEKSSYKQININDFDLVMFRPDPPVDNDYINATYIFDFVDRDKTVLLNDPKSVRDFNEKLHAVKFLHLMPENIVTSSKSDITEFLDEYGEIILKPLNGCFGMGVMTLSKGDKNTAVIINTMTDNGKRKLMVQKYIPKAKYGDKRVMFLGDEVLDVCIQKLPSNDDFKFNDHCDANIIKAELSSEEKENFLPVARELNKLGLPMVGLDVIDGKIVEINVTSPCYFIKEINYHHGIELEKKITDFIISRIPVCV